ncbi:NAD(P)/FAD-dependent oxidoreductase [Chitinimonas sp. BJB300]|uniref:NAD(P)/FAD-dependent oxidoreductase n=1 Tax=Chitinimonas sp. BJB300 TaxID=1559339 RepID=UPI000C0FDC0C|nr:FAD-binding oxidoreductase [Chitinimonas sp. BJB300]PHV10137.1 FAD-dependent oxidoreductase [Chitinimonas sp. BJB300]TSJ87563.1 FAD-binding oxidoreductase [Chitinimonas sp. BJB300]
MALLNHAHQSHIDSYYVASAGTVPDYPKLDGSQDCDVCVVGGGLAGISAALNLAERGLKVILLEGSRLAHAASGRNGGQVINGYACDMDTISNALGEAAAKVMWDMSLEAIHIIEDRVTRHSIDCDWTRGHVVAAVTTRKYRELVDWQADAERRFGYKDYTLWDKTTLRSHLDSPRYAGGLYDALGGHIHPLKYALGLARAAKAAGVRIFEQTPVNRIEQEPSPRAYTSNGVVSCQQLVLAANVFIDELVPVLGKKIMPVGTYVITTEPLGEARARSLINPNFAVADNQFVLDYYRLTADHRLLFGGKVSYSGLPPANLKAAMRHDMLRVFPQLADVKIAHGWGGFVDITMNRAPHWGRLSPNVYFCQGFSGHGVAVTGLAGRLIAEAIADGGERLDLFAKLNHASFPGGKLLRTPSLVLGMAWYRLHDYF